MLFDKQAAAYAAFYRDHIKNDIMPFWDERCIDSICGGYLTCFDRFGNVTDDRKYIWFQGRQLYAYALLYNRFLPDPEYLEKAAHGFRFLADKAYAGNGRWNYILNRMGNVQVGTCSIFADMHVLQGLGEYMTALRGKHEEGMKLLRETYDALERNMFDPYFKDIYENHWKENHIWHDMYLTCLSAVMPCIPVLGAERTRRLADECLDKLCSWFPKDDRKLIFETVSWKGEVFADTAEDQFINPGHMSETSWFLSEMGRLRGDEALLRRGAEICGWAYDAGYDHERGGLYSYLNADGSEPVAIDWFKETNSLWDDKVWWANAELLCALAKSYEFSGDRRIWDSFVAHHEYCQRYFFDPEYGEWYERLHADNSVKVPDKGTEWKCAFHLVRALVFTMESLDRTARGAGGTEAAAGQDRAGA
mgnify:CR=1 FL=1